MTVSVPSRLTGGHLRGIALLLAVGATSLLQGCSGSPGESASTDQLAQDHLKNAVQVLQADSIKTLEVTAAGRWYQFGQAPVPGAAWPPFDVSSYTASLNFEAPAARVQIVRKQIVEPGRVRPVPVEQRADQYVNGATAWNLAPPQGSPPGTPPVVQPQAAAVHERLSEIWTTPQGFLKAAVAHKARATATDKGTEISFNADGHAFEGVLDAQHQVAQVKTWIDNPVLGDTLVEFQYDGYQDFNGTRFPSHIVRKQGGYPVLDLTVSAVKANGEVSVPVPAEAAKAPAQVVVSETLAPGVYYLRGGSHHSVLIEQQDHLVLVEAPLNEDRSNALIAKIKELVPGKPIRYVVNTHQHFDHSGGLRTFVDQGAIIVTHAANRSFYEEAWSTPHQLQPDALAGSKKSAEFETFSGQHVLDDGKRKIQLHELTGNGHNDAFIVVYLPAEKILVEADAYTPLPAGVPKPATPNPFSVNLYENIQRLKLDVRTIAALHGPGKVTLADLENFIGWNQAAN